MGLFGTSFKLTPEQKELYYESLKDLYKILGQNYKASALLFDNLKVLELHTDNKIVKKDFEKLNIEIVKRIKKLKSDNLEIIDLVYPFETMILSLQDNFITIVHGEKYIFSFLCTKNDLNIGSIYNIVLPKATEMISQLEDIEKEEIVEQNQDFDDQNF